MAGRGGAGPGQRRPRAARDHRRSDTQRAAAGAPLGRARSRRRSPPSGGARGRGGAGRGKQAAGGEPALPRRAAQAQLGSSAAIRRAGRGRGARRVRGETLADRAHRRTGHPRTARRPSGREGGSYAGGLRRTRGVTVPVLMTAAALASSPPPLPGFLEALSSPLQHFGVWAIALLIMLEDFGIPVPGETILIAGAVYAGAGRLNIVAVGVVAFCAAIIGDNIGFAIGHFGGRALALRWGKYVFLTEERLDKAQAFFDRRGAIVITFARFVEGLRQANGIIAGISGMHWLRFLAFNALGAALWVGTWVSLGYLAGSHITAIYHYITLYSYYVLIALAVLLAAYITRRVLRHRRRRAAQAREAA